MLIDIKEVYCEVDDEWYHNPFEHHGIRMNKAAEIYAPGWEQRPGHASYKSEQFWARQIPTQQVKLSQPIGELDQCDLCYSVGTQLGRGHARASTRRIRKAISTNFETSYPTYLAAANEMRRALLAAHAKYCANAAKKGLLGVAR